MTNGGDWLKKSWDDSRQGDAVKTADLVNRTFTIHSVDPVEFKSNDGEMTWDWVGVITIDGEAEPVKAWLGGRGVREQVSDMVNNSRLPQRVTMSLEGRAYELTWPRGPARPQPAVPQAMQARPPAPARAPAASPQAATTATESPATGPWAPRQGDTPLQQLGHWLTHHGWTARDAMVALGVDFKDNTVKDDWQTFINRVATQSKDLMEAYGKVLTQLVAYMEAQAQGPDSPDDIPFEGGDEQPEEEIPFE